VAAHFSLGVLHAKQGFRGDAKHHFVEYAERMHRAGREDEALRALREFADLCAAGDDVREMLAQHLARVGRGGQAAGLQAVLEAQLPAQRPAGPAATPAGTSRTDEFPAARDTGALVFLDLSGAPEPADDEGLAGAVVEGFEGTSWEAPATIGLADERIGLAGETLDLADAPLDLSDGPIGRPTAFELPAPARPTTVYASALPGELGMLELPLAWEPAGAATLVLDAEEPVAVMLDEVRLDVPELDIPDLYVPELDVPELDVAPFGAAPNAVDTLAVEELALDAPAEGAELTFLTVEEPVAEAEAPALLDVALDAPAKVEAIVAPATIAAAPTAPAAPAAPAGDFVDLGDWLRETEAPRSTRMVTAEPSQTGDEEADFQRMLEAFKAGVERNIEEVDYDSHYDLGVAFREMGLLEEAATQFQRASRAPGRPLRAIEALGQCLIDLGHHELALEALRRGVEDGATGNGALPDQQLVGVIYLLGVASEQTQRSDAACAYYRRVLATDLQFRDAGRRLAQLSAPPR
jgi:hypothetical protein